MNVFRWMQACLMSALVFFWGPYLYHLYYMTKSGVSFGFTGTYWALAIIATFFTIVTIKYIRHPFGLVGACIMEILYGWLSFSLWLSPILWWKNHTMVVGAAFWGISCIIGFVLGMYLIKRRKQFVLDWAFSWKKLEALAIAMTALIAFFWWAYGGFGWHIQMQDPGSQGPSYFKVSFWGFPSGGVEYDAYTTPAAQAELGAYQSLNTTFYIGVTPTMLNTTYIKSNLTSILREWNKWNLHAVINIQPLAPDGTPDTVGYYNIDIAENLTMDVLQWRQTDELWNIEGICFDGETPKYGPGVPDYDTYFHGETQMAVIIDRIQKNNDSLKVTVFAPASRAWDLVMDYDADLDFLAMTLTHPPTNWDRYGFKTFRSGPRYMSPYWTYMHQQYVVTNYGVSKSVPLIGNAGQKNFQLESGDKGFYELMNDTLICKYLGVTETIINSAASFTKSYASENGSERLTRIRSILDQKPNLDFPITNDWDYYANFTNYILMGNFDSIYASADLFRDLATNIGDIFTFLYVPLFCYYVYLGVIEKRTPRKPRPSLMERIRQRRAGELAIE